MTSHDVVQRVRHRLGVRRVGHAGTLDPMANGVLPVAVGTASRLLEYLPTDKRYRLHITLGRTTDTLDAEGTTLSESPCTLPATELSTEALQARLDAMSGEVLQVIPMYSAKRVQGKKLYELARQGIAVEAQTKPVTIHTMTLQSVIIDENPAYPVLVVDVHCGSGTFMRAIARDFGEKLGCGATLTALTRTAHGRFTLEAATSLETFENAENLATQLLNPAAYLEIPLLAVDHWDKLDRFLYGESTPFETMHETLPAMRDKDCCGLTREGRMVAVARWTNRKLKPVKVFEPATVG